MLEKKQFKAYEVKDVYGNNFLVDINGYEVMLGWTEECVCCDEDGELEYIVMTEENTEIIKTNKTI